MAQNSKLERFRIFLAPTLPLLLKILNTWLSSAVMAVGSIYLFVKNHHMWGSALALLTLLHFIFFTVARTIGFFETSRDLYISLKHDDIPDAPQAYLEESPPVYAGFLLRSGAFLIDCIILFIPRQIFYWAISFLKLPLNPTLIHAIIDVFLCWIYFATLPASTLQGTFGMRACGLRVCNYDFGRIGFGRSAARATIMLISLTTFIGCVMTAFMKKKQSLHDLCARTYVVL